MEKETKKEKNCERCKLYGCAGDQCCCLCHKSTRFLNKESFILGKEPNTRWKEKYRKDLEQAMLISIDIGLDIYDFNVLWQEQFRKDVIEKLDDLLCFVAEEDAEYRNELKREYSRGRRDALREAIKNIKSLY